MHPILPRRSGPGQRCEPGARDRNLINMNDLRTPDEQLIRARAGQVRAGLARARS
jgi:hypothetical protein